MIGKADDSQPDKMVATFVSATTHVEVLARAVFYEINKMSCCLPSPTIESYSCTAKILLHTHCSSFGV